MTNICDKYFNLRRRIEEDNVHEDCLRSNCSGKKEYFLYLTAPDPLDKEYNEGGYYETTEKRTTDNLRWKQKYAVWTDDPNVFATIFKSYGSARSEFINIWKQVLRTWNLLHPRKKAAFFESSKKITLKLAI